MRAGDLRASLDTYLAVRRAVGFPMRPEARLFRDFIAFLERRGLDHPVSAQAAWTGQRRRPHAVALAAIWRAQVGLGLSPAFQLHQRPGGACHAALGAYRPGVPEVGLRNSGPPPDGFVFPNALRGPLTRHDIAYRLAQAVARTRAACPSFATKGGLAPRHSPYDGDAPAPGWRGSRDDRPARSPGSGDHAHVCRSRSRPQGTGLEDTQPARPRQQPPVQGR